MHHIQKSIIEVLAKEENMSFSNLKPADIENKLFDYHLKLTIRDGFVEKTDSGYALTSTGKKMWKRISEKTDAIAERAFSVLFLIVRKLSGEWLLYRRKTHPLLDRVGHMHCTPTSYEQITETAKRCCREKTGLIADFRVAGSGYFRVFNDAELESFTHFTLLVSENAEGELTAQDELADYFWAEDPDFSAPDMLPNMKLLGKYYEQNQNSLFFIDETLSS